MVRTQEWYLLKMRAKQQSFQRCRFSLRIESFENMKVWHTIKQFKKCVIKRSEETKCKISDGGWVLVQQ